MKELIYYICVYYIIMKEAVVVFNSLVNATGANHNDLTYQFDWSILDEGEYLVSFTYHGLNDANTGTKLPLVFIDLGVGANVYATSATNNANQSLFLGTLLDGNKNGTNAQYYAEETTNVPIRIKGRPTNQSPRIFLQNIDGTPFTDSNAGELNDYVLALRFSKCD